jgi:hypothetical protein
MSILRMPYFEFEAKMSDLELVFKACQPPNSIFCMLNTSVSDVCVNFL